MVATLARSGNNSYSLGNQRSFDAWGSVRLGAQTGDPSGRYCGNLGHKQDDESGLIYMRARYYEPASGRFLSEDPSRNGPNWVVYCGNNPVGAIDVNGRDWSWLYLLGTSLILVGMTLLLGVSPQYGQDALYLQPRIDKLCRGLQNMEGNSMLTAEQRILYGEALQIAQGDAQGFLAKQAYSKYAGYMMLLMGFLIDGMAYELSAGRYDSLETAAVVMGCYN